jgi:hypothetical protein
MQSSVLRHVMYWLVVRTDIRKVLGSKLNKKTEYLEDFLSSQKHIPVHYLKIRYDPLCLYCDV